MQQRDTFLVCESGLDDHLWIILSDPTVHPDQLVCVNVTTWNERRDPSCRLRSQDHPWIRHESCIFYEEPKILKGPQLDLLLASRLIESKESVSPDVFDRIIEGALKSPHLPLHIRDLLSRQGIIEL